MKFRLLCRPELSPELERLRLWARQRMLLLQAQAIATGMAQQRRLSFVFVLLLRLPWVQLQAVLPQALE